MRDQLQVEEELNDLEILEAYEPVLRFAKSERFFPMDAERYLEHCQIFPSGPQGVVEIVQHLNDVREKRFGKLQSEQYYLRFVNDPLSDSDVWVWWGALSALGIGAAWFDARFMGAGIAVTISVLAALIVFMLASPIRLRIIPAVFAVLLFSALESLPIWFFLKPHPSIGTKMEYLVLLPIYVLVLFYLAVRTMKFILDRIVPEGPGLIMDMLSQATEQIAQEAYRLYARILERDPQPVYYGRVLRERDAEGNQWTVLQYHFFYAFNDWRLAANGMNHHEGDWEMASVYLKNEKPYGMLFSQHRAGYMERWEKVRKAVDRHGNQSNHPLVYVALGSHANYSQPEVIRSPSLYHTGPLQRFIYWVDGLIHFMFLLFNPSEKARQIALKELGSSPTGFLAENAFSRLRDEADHYIVSLPLEIASGDGLRVGTEGDTLREGVVKSTSFLKRVRSDRPVSHPPVPEWRRVILNPEPEWVQYKGLWGVKSMLEHESGPPGPKWERSVKNQAPEVRLRWDRPLDWLKILEESGGE
jgi:hypothetical protein